jgi:hypothetical protein
MYVQWPREWWEDQMLKGLPRNAFTKKWPHRNVMEEQTTQCPAELPSCQSPPKRERRHGGKPLLADTGAFSTRCLEIEVGRFKLTAKCSGTLPVPAAWTEASSRCTFTEANGDVSWLLTVARIGIKSTAKVRKIIHERGMQKHRSTWPREKNT